MFDREANAIQNAATLLVKRALNMASFKRVAILVGLRLNEDPDTYLVVVVRKPPNEGYAEALATAAAAASNRFPPEFGRTTKPPESTP